MDWSALFPNMSARLATALERAGFPDAEALRAATDVQVLHVRGVSRKLFAELARLGLRGGGPRCPHCGKELEGPLTDDYGYPEDPEARREVLRQFLGRPD